MPLSRLGIEADVEADYLRKSAELLPWITNIDARAAPRRRGHDARRGNPPARSGQHCPSGHRYRWSPPRRCRRLAAGHDLLQMHFATSSTSPQAADSPWAPVISSPAVRAALLSELAGCAQQLAPLPVLLSQQVPANGATTPALRGQRVAADR